MINPFLAVMLVGGMTILAQLIIAHDHNEVDAGHEVTEEQYFRMTIGQLIVVAYIIAECMIVCSLIFVGPGSV